MVWPSRNCEDKNPHMFFSCVHFKQFAKIYTRENKYKYSRAHKNGQEEEERVTLIGAYSAGRIFERY